MKTNNLRTWAILVALMACFGVIAASGIAGAGDRKVRVITLESSAAHTAGTEYSSGFLVSSYSEGILLINVSAMTGTPTLDITVQTSEDNSTYFYHSVIGQISATGTTAYPITNFGKYLRLKEVNGGVTTCTYEIEAVLKN